MKILGIGNAIVDVLCRVDDDFLIKNSLTKGTMKLIEEVEFQTLSSSLNIQETISGGSIANSIVGLSKLGNDVGFIGKVNNDDLGQKYEDGLKKENVKFFYSKKKENIPTGTCLILKSIRVKRPILLLSSLNYLKKCYLIMKTMLK